MKFANCSNAWVGGRVGARVGGDGVGWRVCVCVAEWVGGVVRGGAECVWEGDGSLWYVCVCAVVG